MPRLALRASLLVAFSLVTSTATAYAECAWVLWFTSGRTSAITSPSEAFATKKECEQAMIRSDQRVKDYKAKHPDCTAPGFLDTEQAGIVSVSVVASGSRRRETAILGDTQIAAPLVKSS